MYSCSYCEYTNSKPLKMATIDDKAWMWCISAAIVCGKQLWYEGLIFNHLITLRTVIFFFNFYLKRNFSKFFSKIIWIKLMGCRVLVVGYTIRKNMLKVYPGTTTFFSSTNTIVILIISLVVSVWISHIWNNNLYTIKKIFQDFFKRFIFLAR